MAQRGALDPMTMSRDYVVTFHREEFIAEIAVAWRKAAGYAHSVEFNIVDFIENVLARRYRKKGPLTVELFDMIEGGTPAYVEYEPLKLCVDREVWGFAKLGDPESKYILAHEVGHIVLHDHHAKAFSDDATGQQRYVKESSAEWQANTFADYFLVPDETVIAKQDARDIARSCGVKLALAQDRVSALLTTSRPRPKIIGSFCMNCTDFTARRQGSTECVVCGT